MEEIINITIVSTYPLHGSQNIGDKLIEKSTKDLLEHSFSKKVCFNYIWRADKWLNVQKTILDSDLIVFACLAIRENMASKTYPFMQEILKTNIPLIVLAAGTQLTSKTNSSSLFQPLDKSTMLLLKRVSEKSILFSTRGALSQAFCKRNGIKNSIFTGDVAFFDSRFNDRLFQPVEKKMITKIAISDPHYSHLYIYSFIYLINSLKQLFPNAEIQLLQHGKSPLIEEKCQELGVSINQIYKNPDSGLDEYDKFDLHVGYRVHGHVSALKRRIPSYLIEQDGRGNDYGSTFSIKCSVRSISDGPFVYTVKNILRFFLMKKVQKKQHIATVDHLISIIDNDLQTNLRKFKFFDGDIKTFNENLLSVLKNSIYKL